MKGHIAVEIPVKKYIKAYIISKLGAEPKITRDNIIGSKLMDLLQHKTNPYRSEFSTRYTEKLTIYLPMRTFMRYGCNLHETNIKDFNNFLEDIIKDKYYEMMDDAINVFPSFEANLDGIRLKLGINDDDWSTDSMKKDYYRYRKQKGKPLLYKKNFARFVPSIPLHQTPFSFAK